jgi:hypothetical protein
MRGFVTEHCFPELHDVAAMVFILVVGDSIHGVVLELKGSDASFLA